MCTRKSRGAELWISWGNTGMKLDKKDGEICLIHVFHVRVASSENASYVTKLFHRIAKTYILLELSYIHKMIDGKRED